MDVQTHMYRAVKTYLPAGNWLDWGGPSTRFCLVVFLRLTKIRTLFRGVSGGGVNVTRDSAIHRVENS